MHLAHVFFTLLGLILCLWTLPLALELLVLSVAAAFPARQLRQAPPTLRLAIIIPAHNEEKLITASVSSIRASMRPEDAIYVVAHNSSDATAAHAEAAGAQVLVLNEDSGGGKGVALHYGFTQALTAGADAVLVIDADSIVLPELLPLVAAALQGGSRALQCRYVVANAGATSRTRLMALAFLGMNVLRPRGRSRLGLSCGIFGNGFALTASTLHAVPYLAHSVVEDLEYHLHLVRAGIRVDFLDEAKVLGEMPDNAAAAGSQRSRWEGGRMRMRGHFTRPLLLEVLRGRVRLLEPLLDLLALPLATEAGVLLLALLFPFTWLRLYAAGGLLVLLLYVVMAACLDEEPVQNLKALASAPFYVLFKLATLPRTLRASRTDAAWVRTARNEDSSDTQK